MTDRFQAHVSVVVVGLFAILGLAGVLWQVTHGHDVDALLAGLVGTALGALLPSPAGRQTVTVDNPPDQPVPVDAAP